MNIIIKPMESDSEIKGKAYVHWKAWQETYSGFVDQAYNDKLTERNKLPARQRARQSDHDLTARRSGICGEEYRPMNKTFSLLGGVSAVLLLGSFFVEDVPQDIMRLLGFILLIAYCAYKIMRTSKNSQVN